MSSHCCRMLRAGCSVSIMPRLVSTEGGSFFFQPLQFHLESPDLLIEFRFLRCLLLPLLSPVPLKDLLPFFQELFLPASYQRRVNLILAGDLRSEERRVGKECRCRCSRDRLEVKHT